MGWITWVSAGHDDRLYNELTLEDEAALSLLYDMLDAMHDEASIKDMLLDELDCVSSEDAFRRR
jgi:hypothetical protein